MANEINFSITLVAPPPGVDFALQKGHGNAYETTQLQRSIDKDLHFTFTAAVKLGGADPDFSGPFVQGRPGERFVYIDIGSAAGQMNTQWHRRLKVPLKGISLAMISDLPAELFTSVAGTGKDGGPNCATVKPFSGWRRS